MRIPTSRLAPQGGFREVDRWKIRRVPVGLVSFRTLTVRDSARADGQLGCPSKVPLPDILADVRNARWRDSAPAAQKLTRRKPHKPHAKTDDKPPCAGPGGCRPVEPLSQAIQLHLVQRLGKPGVTAQINKKRSPAVGSLSSRSPNGAGVRSIRAAGEFHGARTAEKLSEASRYILALISAP